MSETPVETLSEIIRRVEQQEATVLLPSFDNTAGRRLGEILVGFGVSRGLPITVDVTRGDQQLFHAALDGTAAWNDRWLARKITTVRTLGVSSYLAGLQAKVGGHVFEEAPWVDARLMSGHGGGYPVKVAGTGLVGTVAVSGLPDHEDHALAVEALEQLAAELGA